MKKGFMHFEFDEKIEDLTDHNDQAKTCSRFSQTTFSFWERSEREI